MSGRMPVEQGRATLVEAALEIAVEEGVGVVTTRNVCSRANAHLSVFHYCFSGKDELIEMMVRRIMSDLAESFDYSSSSNLRGLIRQAYHLLSSEWDYAFTLYELVVASARVDYEPGKEPSHFQTFIGGVEQLLVGYAEREGFRWAVPESVVATLIVTFLEGIGVGWISDHVPDPEKASREDALEAFIDMIEGLQVRD